MSWPEVAIEDLVTVRGGGTPPRHEEQYFQGEIPWITPKDMKTWEISNSQIRITSEAIENSAAKLIPADTVLLVVRSGVLKHTAPVAINRCPVTINQDMKSLECGSRLLPEYLARFLKASEPMILSWVRATTADNYSIDKLRSLRIPLPPLNEQRRIATILDQADTLRRKRTQSIVRTEALAHSLFVQMFGSPRTDPDRWPTVRFEEVCSDETSLSDKLQRGDYAAEGSLPIIDQGQKEIAGWTSNKRMMCRSELPVIVFGDHTRAVKYIDYPFAIGADGAKVLKPTSKVLPRFFAQLLREQPIPDLGYSRHMRELKRMLFPCPPRELQAEFSETAKKSADVLRAMRSDLEKLNVLFSTLQRNIFSTAA